MDKRLAKRHKRQVARAQSNVKVSEPDVRTHEEIEAAREASMANSGISTPGKVAAPQGPARRAGSGMGSAAKTDNG
ncbi:MAG: hypothetical protein ACKV2U_04010 [Bryobacteraceae bacterium]